MKQLHPIQLQILRKLLFAKQLRYHEAKPNKEMENNQFDFHLDELIAGGYVQKENNHYLLTNFGKEYSNRMDTDRVLIDKQAKISAWICCVRDRKGQTEYLIYTRLKQPFYGCQGFLGGKVQYGETFLAAAKRELKEEAGLSGKAQLVGTKHFMVRRRKTHELLEDKLMLLYAVKNPKGKLITQNEEGRYEWVAEKDLKKYVTNPFESYSVFQKHINLVKNFTGTVTLWETNHYTDKF